MVASTAGAVAAIGNFDGVHRGHQYLLARTVDIAAGRATAVAAIVFDPHPRRFFKPDSPPFLLTPPQRRNALLTEAGADMVISLRFDATLAALSPEAFVADVLKNSLGLVGVVTGEEFRFGADRSGDAKMLIQLCAGAGIEAVAIAPMLGACEEKIGSSAIRAAITAGDVRAAAAMLGRRWAVEGVVALGQKLGRTLGFPTANFTLGEIVEPRYGVYAVRATTSAGRSYDGVANFGRRPTVGSPEPLLETHLFDFTGDLYGEPLEVAFEDFIREERKFESLEALRDQIALDSIEARRRLAQ
jgi:riboflavin kinase/FMN adenylyltransferase